ncbi:hypothetical protein GWK47_045477 [Chionoecetes opilio]|uniref:Endonuclease/exonuclease/phosphatase domain-containing protein n=1 Tax=Chionoecetes opilio TaxID=41210 RepID=A0A8J5CHJ4_CHIOP|nr:hypothetical protein GWK47_045477 [Chionoecetes opilio]
MAPPPRLLGPLDRGFKLEPSGGPAENPWGFQISQTLPSGVTWEAVLLKLTGQTPHSKLRLKPPGRPSPFYRAAPHLTLRGLCPFRAEHYSPPSQPPMGDMETFGAPNRPAPHHFPAALIGLMLAANGNYRHRADVQGGQLAGAEGGAALQLATPQDAAMKRGGSGGRDEEGALAQPGLARSNTHHNKAAQEMKEERNGRQEERSPSPPGMSLHLPILLTMALGHTNTKRCDKPGSSELMIVSANVRGFHTNIGELTHNVIIKNRADIVFVCETFLDDKVPPSYARVRGYSAWLRKDRSTQGRGVAFCYRETVNVQVDELLFVDSICEEVISFPLEQHDIRYVYSNASNMDHPSSLVSNIFG